MRKDVWAKKIVKYKQWAENQPESENLSAIQLSIHLGDLTEDADARRNYWKAMRSIGQVMEGFPYQPRKNKPNFRRDGGLRQQFEKKIHSEKSSIMVRGRVVYVSKEPSLCELTVTGNLWVGEERIERKVREICDEYSINPENIHFSYKEKPKPIGRSSRYENTGRSGSYHGGNRWNPGL